MSKTKEDMIVNSKKLQKYAFELAAFDYLLAQKQLSRKEFDKCIAMSQKEAGITPF